MGARLGLAAVLAAAVTGVAIGGTAWAVPTRDELYRSDRLKVVVYKDSQDANVLWYLPPLKLYENEGKVVYYRRPKDDKVHYYFYVVPYMTDDLVQLLAGELPMLRNTSQFRPVTAKQFGVQVRQFDAVSMGDAVTDYQYLNQPQLIRVSLPAAQADEFDFFVQNKPGIQANVLFHFETERMDKYVTIELSHKEVYNALDIGGTGRYKFTKAEIQASIANYLSKKYFSVKSKGDLPIPEIVNKVIEECFTPYKRPDQKKDKPKRDWDDWLTPEQREEADALWTFQERMLDTLGGGELPWEDDGRPTDKKAEGDGLEFTFKKELSNSDKSFFYKQEHYVDTTEIASIPVYLSLAPAAVPTRVKATPLPKRDFVVEAANEQTKPYLTGINVGVDEQYIINAVFAYSAHSAYGSGLRWYRWASTWPSPDEDLYYRVGTGPWVRVGGRAVLKTDEIYRGELQLYLDRKRLFEKIPAEYKDPKMLGVIPAIFTYGKTYPQFNVVVTGRKVEVN